MDGGHSLHCSAKWYCGFALLESYASNGSVEESRVSFVYSEMKNATHTTFSCPILVQRREAAHGADRRKRRGGVRRCTELVGGGGGGPERRKATHGPVGAGGHMWARWGAVRAYNEFRSEI